MDVSSEDLAAVLKALPKAGFVGCNVTIPHKEAALALADVVTDRAAAIGAANTLTFLPDGRIHADNTDGYGFVANIQQNAPDWEPTSGPAAIFGAGGAARAVISSLIGIGVSEIRIANRSRARADALRQEFGETVKVFEWADAGKMMSGAVTVVNSTSLGMVGKDEFDVPLDDLSSSATVCDIVYTPLHTPLLIAAREKGCTIVDGLGMLLHQATPGFERWFGQRPEVTEGLRAIVLGP
jgi:shikimate dehydrogenase